MIDPVGWSLQRVGFPRMVYSIPADKQMVIIGRRPADIICEGRKVSRFHCRLDFFHGIWHVTDLESVEGVFINKKLISVGQPTLLQDGDIIGIGVSQMSYSGSDTYLFKFCRNPAREQVSKSYSSLKSCQVVLKDVGSLLINQHSISVDSFFQLASHGDCDSNKKKKNVTPFTLTPNCIKSCDESHDLEPVTSLSCHDTCVPSETESEDMTKSFKIRMPEESDNEESKRKVWIAIYDSRNSDDHLHLSDL